MPRKSKYDPTQLDTVKRLCKLGASDKTLAALFNVPVNRINAWKRQHPEFLQALAEAKAEANANVAEALYRRAAGIEIAQEDVLDDDGNVIETREIHVRVPADVTAAKFWLSAREPELWREKFDHKHEHTGLDQILDKVMGTTTGLPADEPTADRHFGDTQH